MTRPGYFEVIRLRAGWHFRYRAANGKVLASSPLYFSKRNATRALTRLQDGVKADAGPLRVVEVDWRVFEPVTGNSDQRLTLAPWPTGVFYDDVEGGAI